MSFASLKLHPNLEKGLKELGFVRPTAIQADAIPPAMAGKDVLACATTGSGKTAAFLLPILHQLMDRPRGVTRALVLTPTRELANQILEDLDDLAVHTPISAAAVIGGVGMRRQEHAFRSGVDVVIATPGRLLDHFRSPYAKLGGIQFLVLDEADRMLDMGFLPEIRRVLRHLPATRRQTLFFSATLPAPIAALAREMLQSPVTFNTERQSAPAIGITQAVYPVAQEMKPALLTALLKRGDMAQALVFTRTKHRADRLATHLQRQGILADRIHGNRSQVQRNAALAGFKRGRCTVLVATDIAARGIDVEALGHVVNFDVPMTPDDYIHRVGRTGRMEATGEAFTFVAPQEEPLLRAIEKVVGKRLPRVQVPDFDYQAKPEGRLELRPPRPPRPAQPRGRGPRGGGSSRPPSRGAPHGGSRRDGGHEPARTAPAEGDRSGGERPGAARGESSVPWGRSSRGGRPGGGGRPRRPAARRGGR